MIRMANFNDANTIADILVDTWQNAYSEIVDLDYLKRLSKEKYYRIFKDIIEENKQTVFVYEASNQIIGFISGKTQNGLYDSEVIGLYIHPGNQRKRIGSKLLYQMKNHFRISNCKNMIIWTLLGAKNNKFYEHHCGIRQETKKIQIGSKEYSGIGYCFEL